MQGSLLVVSLRQIRDASCMNCCKAGRLAQGLSVWHWAHYYEGLLLSLDFLFEACVCDMPWYSKSLRKVIVARGPSDFLASGGVQKDSDHNPPSTNVYKVGILSRSILFLRSAHTKKQ